MKYSGSISSNEAEVDVSKASYDQKKNFDDRLERIEEMINYVGGSLQKLKASLSENKSIMMENYLNLGESILKNRTLIAEKKALSGIKKNLKQGILQATFNIDGVTNRSLCSEAICCAGASWWLDVRKTGQSLALYLFHKADSVNISYDTNYTARLLGLSENIELKCKNCFTSEVAGWGWSSFVLWSKLVNFSNGFVDEKGGFKIQVEFTVKGNTITCEPLDTQFLTCGLVESDCTLLVEDRRFSVNKGLISAYSNYFKTLFYGEFCEKDQDEIELKEVCSKEFLYLLKVIYPPFDDADVNQNNVESLLRLADCYQVKAVSNQCSNYLKKCVVSEVPLQDKLMFAQNYGLSELLEHCVEEYKTVDDVKKLRESDKYSLLDKDIRLRICENVI